MKEVFFKDIKGINAVKNPQNKIEKSDQKVAKKGLSPARRAQFDRILNEDKEFFDYLKEIGD